MKCDKCNGKGLIPLEGEYLITCSKCKGKKELDWLENVFGPNIENYDLWYPPPGGFREDLFQPEIRGEDLFQHEYKSILENK